MIAAPCKATKPRVIKCVQCGTPLPKTKRYRRYCSEKCRVLHFQKVAKDGRKGGLVEKPCAWCETVFKQKRGNQIYCKVMCRVAAMQDHKKHNRRDREHGLRIPRVCQRCHKKYVAATGNQKYCSFVCQQSEALDRAQGTKAPPRQGPKKKARRRRPKTKTERRVRCKHCRKWFTKGKQSRQIYCSILCQRIARVQRQRKALELVACVVCETIYRPVHVMQLYCSKACKEKEARRALKRSKAVSSKAAPRECLVCGMIFDSDGPWNRICGKPRCQRPGKGVTRTATICS